jgi:hypothetical protein
VHFYDIVTAGLKLLGNVLEKIKNVTKKIFFFRNSIFHENLKTKFSARKIEILK